MLALLQLAYILPNKLKTPPHTQFRRFHQSCQSQCNFLHNTETITNLNLGEVIVGTVDSISLPFVAITA